MFWILTIVLSAKIYHAQLQMQELRLLEVQECGPKFTWLVCARAKELSFFHYIIFSLSDSKSFLENWPASWWGDTRGDQKKFALSVWLRGASLFLYWQELSKGPEVEHPSKLSQDEPSVIPGLPRIWKTFTVTESSRKFYQTFKQEIISILHKLFQFI